jgi:hypothetical protein
MYLGKKWTMIGLAFPFIAGWIIIIFANSAPLFYLGRLITGFSGLLSSPTVPVGDMQCFAALWNRNWNGRNRNFLNSGTGTGTVTR